MKPITDQDIESISTNPETPVEEPKVEQNKKYGVFGIDPKVETKKEQNTNYGTFGVDKKVEPKEEKLPNVKPSDIIDFFNKYGFDLITRYLDNAEMERKRAFSISIIKLCFLIFFMVGVFLLGKAQLMSEEGVLVLVSVFAGYLIGIYRT